jgi:hypothetical protein
MTLGLHFRREQSWLLWLPVIAVVCFLPAMLALLNSNYTFSNYALAIARGVVLVISLLLVHGVGLRRFGNRGIRYAKEFRGQARGVILAIFIPALLASFPDQNVELRYGHVGFSSVFYFFGCATLGATAFGVEFEHRTIGSFLAQPVYRWVLLGEKLLPLAILLTLGFVQFTLSALIGTLPGAYWMGVQFSGNFSVFFLAAVIPPVFAFCTGPALTLLTRGTLAAGVFTVAIPSLLALGVSVTVPTLYRFVAAAKTGVSFFDVPLPDDLLPSVRVLAAILLLFYLLAGLVSVMILFRRLGWKESVAQASSSGVHPLAVPLDRFLGAALGRGKISSLIRKELRLHPAPFLVAMLGTVCWLLWQWAHRLNPSDFPLDSDIGQAVALIIGGLVTVLAGGGCVAEERQLGTLDWQLTQPVSVRLQWSVKLVVAFCVAALLGGVLPMTLARFGLTGTDFQKSESDLLRLFSFMPLLFAVAVYASSVCRNSVNAAVMSLPLTGAVILLGFIPTLVLFLIPLDRPALWRGPDFLQIHTLTLLPVVALLLLWTAAGNFKLSVVNIGRVVRQLLFLCLGVVVISSVFLITLLTINTAVAYFIREPQPQAENLRSDPKSAHPPAIPANRTDHG